MARFRKNEKKTPDTRPIQVNDFIYNDPDGLTDTGSDALQSDTPDEAIRKFRGRPKEEPSEESPVSSEPDSAGDDEDPIPDKKEPATRKVYSSGVILDDDLQPVDVKGRKPRKEHRGLRNFVKIAVTIVLLLTIAAYVFHRISPATGGLGQPEDFISRIVTPVQTFFSGLTDAIADYFYDMKYRANLEDAYEQLRAENERLVYQAMLADELQHTLSQYEDLSDEIKANINMRPIVCTVIGKSDSNYFSTFTINKGTNDGVEDYMAVTINGALVGYTENTHATSSTVRTIIDSNASIAALIQSSRDQGNVRGTLGIDGKPMCRMYYLPADNLPRSGDMVVTSGVGMSFPKGIPIGIVRESTRGMQDNKQYIVLEPQVDFQHLEYVIVLRYKPEPVAVEGRDNSRSNIPIYTVEPARPSPVVPEIADSLFEVETPGPGNGDGTVSTLPPPSVEPTPGMTLTPEPVITPDPEVTPGPSSPTEVPLEYQVVNLSGEPTPEPTPTFAPTATPYLPPDPEDMTWEEE